MEDCRIFKITGYDPAIVWVVDGQYIRDNIYVNFTEGGNDIVYGGGPLARDGANFIPPNEIWLDCDVNPHEMKVVLLHEIVERNLMYGGMEYEKAHEESDIIEEEARADYSKVDGLIQEYLKGFVSIPDTATARRSIKAQEDKRMSEKLVRKLVYSTTGKVVEKNRSVEFIGSTETEDRDGEVIKADGWVLDNFLKNPVILWCHQYNEPPIGRATSVKVKGGKLVFQVEFADEDTYPFADTIYKLAKSGYINATSVGFRPIEWELGQKDGDPSRTFTKQELLELSLVPVPSNPNALISARDAGILSDKEYALSVKSFSIPADFLPSGGVLKEKVGEAPPTPVATADIPFTATITYKEVVTKPEATENTIRIPVKGQEGKHDGHKLRTIQVSKKDGIQGLYCVDCKKITTFIFDKEKWAKDEADKWVQDHEKAYEPNPISQAAIRDELEYNIAMLRDNDLDEVNKGLAKTLMVEIMRLTGGDTPDDIWTMVKGKSLFRAIERCKSAIKELDTEHEAHNRSYGVEHKCIDRAVRSIERYVRGQEDLDDEDDDDDKDSNEDTGDSPNSAEPKLSPSPEEKKRQLIMCMLGVNTEE